MSPLPEGPVTLNWHDPELNLSTPGGASEAKQFLKRLNASSDGGTISFEYDESGKFPATGTASEAIEKLSASDPGWVEDGRYHVEVDPIRGSI